MNIRIRIVVLLLAVGFCASANAQGTFLPSRLGGAGVLDNQMPYLGNTPNATESVPEPEANDTEGIYRGLTQLAREVGGTPMPSPNPNLVATPAVNLPATRIANSVENQPVTPIEFQQAAQTQIIQAAGLQSASQLGYGPYDQGLESAYLTSPLSTTSSLYNQGSGSAAVGMTSVAPVPVESVYVPSQPAKTARFWARGETLLWFVEGLNSGPVATTNPGGTPAPSVGLLSNPSSSSLFGGSLGDGLRVGGRATFGWWLSCGNERAIQGDFFGLGNGSSRFDSGLSNGSILSRPFTNTDIGGEDAQIISFPGLSDGSLTADFNSDLWSAGLSMRRRLCCNFDPCNPCSMSRLDLLYGYRYLEFDESFRSQETLLPTDPRFVPGTSLTLDDRIRTSNEFHGFEFGLQSSSIRGRWSTQLASLVAIGSVEKRVRLDGSTTSFVPGLSNETIPGGFIVGPDMIGTGKSREFGVIPQARLNFGYFLTRNIQINAGYNFLYLFDAVRPDSWLNVTRAGSEISRRQDSIPARTDLPVPDNGVWMHGASLGFTFTY